jgi:hypothetical protein
MADPPVVPVEIGGIGDIEMAHEFAEIALRRLGQQMNMIGHQHKAVYPGRIGGSGFREYLEKFPAVGVIFENGFLLIATVSDMVHGAGKLDAKGSGHDP